MTTYVLVHGFWLGGWAWRPVTQALRAAGHDVYPVTLTGTGERAHLARPEVDLETHIQDALGVLRFEDLHDVVLVGHSYGGLVTTGVADRAPERISRLVYVDTGPLPEGMSQNDFIPEQKEANAAQVEQEGDGWLLPPPPWRELAAGVEGVDDQTLALLAERAVPQPWASAIAPVRYQGDAWQKLPKLGVLSSFAEAQLRELAGVVPAFRHMAGEGWEYAELPTWHWPMLSRPAELARILLDV
jgi:pimeloyl-ACP methyl ester carboxylesterase